MRATYHKLKNIITVELTEGEVAKYVKPVEGDEDLNLRQVDNHYEYTIPCSNAFYLKSQRQRGGKQPWDKEELRAGVRAAVANCFVPAPDHFSQYKREWLQVVDGLHRNVRLLFPSSKHPRQKLSRKELRYRREWRALHNLR